MFLTLDIVYIHDKYISYLNIFFKYFQYLFEQIQDVFRMSVLTLCIY